MHPEIPTAKKLKRYLRPKLTRIALKKFSMKKAFSAKLLKFQSLEIIRILNLIQAKMYKLTQVYRLILVPR
jgi:hypothetical protein